MPDAPMDDGFAFTAAQICDSVGPVLERLWRERGTQPTDIDVPRDGVAIQAMATDLLPAIVVIEREQRYRDRLGDREERSRRDGWAPELLARIVEPVRGKVVWSYAQVSRQLRDDDTRRDLQRLTLLIRRFDGRILHADVRERPEP
jgi:hypothetical protein